jgi:regulator of cell morphogenesis and NO signaling
MENLKDKTLKSIALEHFELIPILEKYSLDFCCKGAKTLSVACTEKNISVDALMVELSEATSNISKPKMPFNEMNAEQLISYILIHHHFYVKTAIPTIYNHLQKVVVKHGSRYPHMEKVLALFSEVAEDLTSHMKKEEEILFPRIKTLYSNDEAEKAAHFVAGYIDAPVSVMEQEHEKVGELLFAIRDLTSHYMAPDTACTTHRVCLDELKAFEEDLHQHVHLENNILFPMAAIKMQEHSMN